MARSHGATEELLFDYTDAWCYERFTLTYDEFSDVLAELPRGYYEALL
jgi:hypothetical protein